MSFMHVFESGEFTPELTGWGADDRRIEVMKVGGGTLGRSYGPGEAWLVQVVDLGDGDVTGTPNRHEFVFTGTHWDVMLETISNYGG